jgi:cell division protein FtsI (penicillin-binding protein 3)
VYYGNLVAGPIFKEVADKVYANSLQMHEELNEQKFFAASATPYSKHGNKKDVETIFAELGISVKSKARDVEWVVTSTQDTSVTIAPRSITENLVPNVVGMGLRDAIYLLENQGLRVKITGSGMVKNQSISAGARIMKGQEIKIDLS